MCLYSRSTGWGNVEPAQPTVLLQQQATSLSILKVKISLPQGTGYQLGAYTVLAMPAVFILILTAHT